MWQMRQLVMGSEIQKVRLMLPSRRLTREIASLRFGIGGVITQKCIGMLARSWRYHYELLIDNSISQLDLIEFEDRSLECTIDHAGNARSLDLCN